MLYKASARAILVILSAMTLSACKDAIPVVSSQLDHNNPPNLHVNLPTTTKSSVSTASGLATGTGLKVNYTVNFVQGFSAGGGPLNAHPSTVEVIRHVP